MNNKPLVVVGMSGGVDSSVAAYLLKQQGYNVVGLFMKNWEEKAADGCCTAEADFSDVKRVCEVLDIPYYAVNFAKQYRDRVFAAFTQGLARGITPNPDILCNREIKFGPFLAHAEKLGAEYIATGHYARLRSLPCHSARLRSSPCHSEERSDEESFCNAEMLFTEQKDSSLRSASFRMTQGYVLQKGADDTKDQSYFLCGLNQRQLSRVLFPVGELKKDEVRAIAARLGLVTAQKKDSTGICFIGERKFRDFMKTYLGNQPGDIAMLDGTVVGRHQGLMYYTLGQRKGLNIGGFNNNTARWFVVRKDLERNILFVSNGECDEMFSRTLIAEGFNHIPREPAQKVFKCTAKVRYRQADQRATAEILGGGRVRVTFDKPQRSVTPGQWVVLYNGDDCLGGGEITEIYN